MTEALEFVSTSRMAEAAHEPLSPTTPPEVEGYVNKSKMGWITNITKTIVKKSENSPKIVSKNSRGVLQRIFKVLYLVVWDNEYACNAMGNMIEDLIELLPLSQSCECNITALL